MTPTNNPIPTTFTREELAMLCVFVHTPCRPDTITDMALLPALRNKLDRLLLSADLNFKEPT